MKIVSVDFMGDYTWIYEIKENTVTFTYEGYFPHSLDCRIITEEEVEG